MEALYNRILLSGVNLYDIETTCSIINIWMWKWINSKKKEDIWGQVVQVNTYTYREQNFIRIAAVKWCLVSKWVKDSCYAYRIDLGENMYTMVRI